MSAFDNIHFLVTLATLYNIVVGGQTLLGRRPFEWGLLNGGGKRKEKKGRRISPNEGH